MKEESELKNSIVRNEESFPEIFGMTKSEVLELFEAIREYHTEANTPSSYKDWCKMYPGIHREGTGEIAQRNWLACFRWLRTNGRLLDRPTPPVEAKTAEEIKKVILSKIKELKTFMHNEDVSTIKNSYYVSIQHMYGLIRDFDAQFTPSAKSVEVEEAAEELSHSGFDHNNTPFNNYKNGVITGSNWQQQKQVEDISRLRKALEGIASKGENIYTKIAKEALKEKES